MRAAILTSPGLVSALSTCRAQGKHTLRKASSAHAVYLVSSPSLLLWEIPQAKATQVSKGLFLLQTGRVHRGGESMTGARRYLVTFSYTQKTEWCKATNPQSFPSVKDLLQQGYTSYGSVTFSDSATNWRSSVQIQDPVEDVSHSNRGVHAASFVNSSTLESQFPNATVNSGLHLISLLPRDTWRMKNSPSLASTLFSL